MGLIVKSSRPTGKAATQLCIFHHTILYGERKQTTRQPTHTHTDASDGKCKMKINDDIYFKRYDIHTTTKTIDAAESHSVAVPRLANFFLSNRLCEMSKSRTNKLRQIWIHKLLFFEYDFWSARIPLRYTGAPVGLNSKQVHKGVGTQLYANNFR